jgi:hypothetical protein
MNIKDFKNKMKVYAQKSYDLMKEIERDKNGNPFTLEETIRSIILKNPGYLQYRDDALGTLYCVLGAGIRWEDGRLGDCHPNNYINMPPDAGGQGPWSIDFGLDDSLKEIFKDCPDLLKKFKQELIEERKKEALEIFKTIDNIDKRCQQYRHEKSWYPISWYGCNLCCPSDAQEDFFNGAIETANLIIGNSPPMGTKLWVDHQRTKKYAQEILRALLLVVENKNG